MFCQNCGAENKEGAAFCYSCGAGLRLVAKAPEELPISGPPPIVCKSCGTQIKPGDIFCSKCLASVPIEMRTAATAIVPSKHNEIIAAKIKTRENQKKGYWVGPMILFLIGAFLLFILWPIGLILIACALIWDSSRSKEATRLKNEIKELELELE
jgi:uncharacterized membrane protein YvbJ